jgi:predicted nucleic acid-binding protein
VILVDANVLMYAGGAAHRCKEPSAAFLRRVARGEVEGAVDAEVLQEILHRYRAIAAWEDGRRLYDLTRRLIPTVLPITAEVTDRARSLLDGYPALAARDALHAAACLFYEAEALCSYDRDFDGIRGLRRIEP